MKKIITIWKWIITVILLAATLFTVGTFAYHTIQTNKEFEDIKLAGYYNPVSIGDYSLNVAKFGNENGTHTIVAMSGLGVGDFSVSARQMTKCLEKDNLVVFVDRAGYGLSGDTGNEMTLENIVEDYRKALKNAGIEGPYILMPHSIGGAYATYWCSKYPKEIEAVVFVDGAQLSEIVYDNEKNDKSTKLDYAQALFSRLGFNRCFLRSSFCSYPDSYTEKEQYLGNALALLMKDSIATLSESDLKVDNARKAFNTIAKNDVPKLYICASWGYETREDIVEHIQWCNKYKSVNGNLSDETPTDATVNELLQQYQHLRQNILTPYLEKMGNCELVLLAGDHKIYEHKPVECGQLIQDFLDKIDIASID